MSVLAAAAIGSFCALGVGFIVGIDPVGGRESTRTASAVARWRAWLHEAGLAVSPAQFALGSAGAAALSLAILSAITGSVFVAAVPAIAIGWLPRAYYARRRSHRLRRAQRAWPDALRDLLASVRAGSSLVHAVGALGSRGPEPLRSAFASFARLAALVGVVPALDVVREELADPTTDRVAEVLAVAHERGGSVVVRILEDLVEATTDDVKLLDALETERLESRINARAVVVLPWVVLVVLTVQEGPFRTFYRGPGGLATLVVGGVLSAVGLATLGRLGRDVPEPRVFADPGRAAR